MSVTRAAQGFEMAGGTWTKEVCQADSDGDGMSNGAELGDADCTWRKGGARRKARSHPGRRDGGRSEAGSERAG